MVSRISGWLGTSLELLMRQVFSDKEHYIAPQLMLGELRGFKICRQTAKTRQPSAVLNLRRWHNQEQTITF